MTEYEDLAEQEQHYRTQKRAVIDDVSTQLCDAVEEATTETGVSVEIQSTSRDGSQQTLTARLDGAALVAAVTDQLPDGFVVEHVNDDGSLTIQWDERESVSEGRRAAAILKAIVAEETVTDSDGLIVEVATRERVVERATDLGVEERVAEQRLSHLVDLGVVDISAGEVYPDSNFSKL